MESKVMESSDWVKRWEEGATGFHKTTIHPLLEQHVGTMINGRSNIRIFVPLCGKALDMKWLAAEGHTVIGVDVAKQALEEFFAEHNIQYSIETASGVDGTLYQSEDKKLQLYCCDLYTFSKDVAGQVDGVWDRGGLVAINNKDHEKYVTIMKSIMAPGCRYLLSAVQYEEIKYGGPPHHLSDEAVEELFEDCDVSLIDDTDAFEDKHRAWGLDWFREKLFLIQPK